MTTTPHLTDGERKRAEKAAKEAARRQAIKRVNAACEKAGITQRYPDLIPDQRRRALTADPNLTGDCLAAFILDGDEPELPVNDADPSTDATPTIAATDTAATTDAATDDDRERLAALIAKGDRNGFTHAEAKERDTLKAKLQPTTATNGTGDGAKRTRRPADAEAAELAKAAQANPGAVRTGLVPWCARIFLDNFEVKTALPTTVTVNPKTGDGITVNRAELQTYIEGGANAAIAKAIRGIVGDHRRYVGGRHFAVWTLAAVTTNTKENT